MSNPIDTYVQTNRQRMLDELKDFLRIPSISTFPENKPDVDRAARFVADALTAAGLENVEVIATDKHPLVYADWLHAPRQTDGLVLRPLRRAAARPGGTLAYAAV